MLAFSLNIEHYIQITNANELMTQFMNQLLNKLMNVYLSATSLQIIRWQKPLTLGCRSVGPRQWRSLLLLQLSLQWTLTANWSNLFPHSLILSLLSTLVATLKHKSLPVWQGSGHHEKTLQLYVSPLSLSVSISLFSLFCLPLSLPHSLYHYLSLSHSFSLPLSLEMPLHLPTHSVTKCTVSCSPLAGYMALRRGSWISMIFIAWMHLAWAVCTDPKMLHGTTMYETLQDGNIAACAGSVIISSCKVRQL